MNLELLEQRAVFSAAMDLIGMTAVRDHPIYRQFDGSGTTVVVIDSAINWAHSLLTNAKVRDITVLGNASPRAVEDHGTGVASVVAGRNADVGVATDAGLIGIRYDNNHFNQFEELEGRDAWLAFQPYLSQILQWVLANADEYNIVAVNMSLGDNGVYANPSDGAFYSLSHDMAALQAAGVAIVSAAGNEFADHESRGVSFPAISSTISASAVFSANLGSQANIGHYTTGPDHIAAFSNRPYDDQTPGLFAPGARVKTARYLGGTELSDGTSFAAPMISGAIAVVQEAAKFYAGEFLSTEDVQTLLLETADVIYDGDDENDIVVNTFATYRRLNVHDAIRALELIYGDPKGDPADLRVTGGSDQLRPIASGSKPTLGKNTAFGQVDTANRSRDAIYTLNNTGERLLTIDSVTIKGRDIVDFRVVSIEDEAVPGGYSTTLRVRFDPSQFGKRVAVVHIQTNDADRPAYKIKLSGRGVPSASAPDVDVTGGFASINDGQTKVFAETGQRFESTSVPGYETRVFTITNVGKSKLTLSTVSISGGSGRFVVLAQPNVRNLLPGRTSVFTIRFAALDSTTWDATVRFTSNDPDEDIFTFRIRGIGQ